MRTVLVILSVLIASYTSAQPILPKTIRHNFFRISDTVLPHPLSLPAVMRVLFPGNFYRVDNPHRPGKLLLEEWVCPTCPIYKMEGWYTGMPEIFPSQQYNRTILRDTLRFIDDSGRQNIMMSFSTIEAIDDDFLGSGRFSCAFMGLAWWRHEGMRWRLIAFSPSTGCFGAFQYIPELRLIKLGYNNYGCYILNSNGGAGSVYYGDLHVFGAVNRQFREVMRADNVHRGNVPSSNWDMELTSTNGSERFGDLKLSVTGDFQLYDFTQRSDSFAADTISNVLREIRIMKPLADSFNFSIIRKYKYTRGWYVPASSRIKKW